MNKTWQTFEHLTAKIQQDLAPNATITHNEQLIGKSGAKNQCDVVLRVEAGQIEFTCVIECKDHKDPVGAELMRAFMGKIDDLPDVHQGILVSANGFTSDALKLAGEHGIKAYKLIDAMSVRWRHEALLPIVFISINLVGAVINFFDPAGNPRSFTTADGAQIPKEKCYVYDRTTQTYRLVSEVVEELWDAALNERIPAPEEEVRTQVGRLQFYLGENRHEEVILQARLQRQLTFHYNTISLANVCGFFDEQEGRLLPTNYETVPLDVQTIRREWPSTTNKDDVPFTPVDFLYLCGFFHRQSRTPQQFTLIRSRDNVDGAIPL